MLIDPLFTSSRQSNSVPTTPTSPANTESPPGIQLPAFQNIEPENAEKKSQYSVGMIAGMIVFSIAIAVTIVALTVIAPGIPQAIVLALGLSLVSLGGLSVIKNLVYRVRSMVGFQQSDVKRRAKHALGLGLAFGGIGLAAQVGAKFIPGGYGAVVNRLGSSMHDKGKSTLYSSLVHYLYLKFFRSQKVANGEPLSLEEVRIEAKKLKQISLGVVILGVSFTILGALLAVAGFALVPGVASTVLIALASPILGASLALILQTLLHTSFGQWKIFIDAASKKQLLVDPGLFDLRNEEVVEPKRPDANEPLIETSKQDPLKDANISFSHKQKMIFAISVLLLLAGIATICVGGFLPLTALQAFLLFSIGGSLSGVVVPLVAFSSFDFLAQAKIRWNIARIKRQEKKSRAEMFDQLYTVYGGRLTKRQEDILWQKIGQSEIQRTNELIQEETKSFRTKQVPGLLAGTCFIACGVGVMLLALIPILAPISAGIIGTGATLFAVGGGFYLQEFAHWLYQQILKIKAKQDAEMSQEGAVWLNDTMHENLDLDLDSD